MRGVRSNGRAGGSSTLLYGESHAAAASREWTAEVALYAADAGASEGEWSEEDQKTDVGDATPYATAVRARIQVLAAGGTRVEDLVEETVPVPGYLVAVDFGQDAEVGDGVEVVACPEDPTLVGRVLRVDHVAYSSTRFQRDLFCTLGGVVAS